MKLNGVIDINKKLTLLISFLKDIKFFKKKGKIILIFLLIKNLFFFFVNRHTR
jgi:hypothetical protein